MTPHLHSGIIRASSTHPHPQEKEETRMISQQTNEKINISSSGRKCVEVKALKAWNSLNKRKGLQYRKTQQFPTVFGQVS